jgi:hypothetical protein
MCPQLLRTAYRTSHCILGKGTFHSETLCCLSHLALFSACVFSVHLCPAEGSVVSWEAICVSQLCVFLLLRTPQRHQGKMLKYIRVECITPSSPTYSALHNYWDSESFFLLLALYSILYILYSKQ